MTAPTDDPITAAYERGRAEALEEAAKVADERSDGIWNEAAVIATAIRALGRTG